MGDKYINGEDGVYYNYVQAASMIGEPDATLRWWVQELDTILNLPTNERGTKRFRLEDIEKLKYIRKLIREDKYSLAQVREYCGESFSKGSSGLISVNGQQQLKELMDIMSNEFELRINSFKEDMLNQQKEMILKLLEGQMQLNAELISEVSDIAAAKTSEAVKEVQSIKSDMNDIKQRQEETIRVSNFNAEEIRRRLESRKPWYIKLIRKLNI